MDTVIIVLTIYMGILEVSSAQPNSAYTDIQLSNQADTWANKPTECYMAAKKYLYPKHLSRLQEALPLNENVWIDARAKPTPYFVFLGCFKNEYGSTQELDTDNSASRCMSHCDENQGVIHYFGLMEQTCLCISEVGQVSIHTRTSCYNSCPGNLNDWCGNNETLALYTMTVLQKWIPPGENIDKTCVVAVDNTSHTMTSTKCSDLYGFKCDDHARTNTTTWSDAVEICRKKRYLKPSLSDYIPTDKPTWTPIKRSSNISWDTNTNISSFLWCVSIRKNKDTSLSLHEEDCERRLRHLLVCKPAGHESGSDEHESADGEVPEIAPVTTFSYLTNKPIDDNLESTNDGDKPVDDARETSEEDTAPSGKMIAIILGIVGCVAVCVLAIVVYKIRKSKTKPRTNAIDNAENGSRSRDVNTAADSSEVTRHDKQTPGTVERVQSAYASIHDVAGNPVATDADTYDTSNTVACSSRSANAYDHAIIAVKKDRGDENVYDHTITTVKQTPHSENVYDHMVNAVKQDRNNENVYDQTSTVMKDVRRAENVYDQTSRVFKETNQNENEYDHTNAPGKGCNDNENPYDVAN